MTKQARIRSLLIIGAVAGLFLVALWPSLTLAAPTPLPPRPSPQPTPTVSSPKSAPIGALIELRAEFGPAWAWSEIPGQALWTVVQWQDHEGDWHDVQGWQGTLDEIVSLVGSKRWWVAKEHLDSGPFRWAILRGRGGALLAVSEPFHLPATEGRVLTIDVPLEGKPSR